MRQQFRKLNWYWGWLHLHHPNSGPTLPLSKLQRGNRSGVECRLMSLFILKDTGTAATRAFYGTACTCVQSTTTTSSGTDTYTVSGNTIVWNNGTTSEFCVEGDSLTFQDPTDFGSAGILHYAAHAFLRSGCVASVVYISGGFMPIRSRTASTCRLPSQRTATLAVWTFQPAARTIGAPLPPRVAVEGACITNQGIGLLVELRGRGVVVTARGNRCRFVALGGYCCGLLRPRQNWQSTAALSRVCSASYTSPMPPPPRRLSTR